VVTASPFDKFATWVSADGRRVLYTQTDQRNRLLLGPIGGDGDPVPLEAGAGRQSNGAISRDGRWLAYEGAGVDDVPEVFVRALDGRGGRRQLSAGGGSQPRWTRGDREIVFRNGPAVLAAAFDPVTGAVGRPVQLFQKADGGRLANPATIGYDVTPDGSRFLLAIPEERPEATPVVVVLNWFEELRRRVP
jgi:Tol biopolymer transport system component